jgi:hypothetical protein
VVHSWPRVSDEPTRQRVPGRFPKSFPLEFPMGIADPYDPDRPRTVSFQEYVQHLLRHHRGMFVNGLRGHRVIWALVNSLLISEASGKGFAVQRNVLRRVGGRVADVGVTTRRQMRQMMEQEDSVKQLVHQLMTVGRDVRSTPML